jgi:hypothetical protein
MKTETFQTHPKVSEEEVYDPLSQAQKHIMLRNGRFEFDNVKQGTCCCGHSDCVDCCLAKTKEICICDGFKEKGVISTYIPKKKLPRKEQEQTADIIVKDGKITQDDQGKFMRQYGII